jgi:hypothetical protein
MCQHVPLCPSAVSPDATTACVVCHHPEQDWCLLCNGVILFEDGGAILPSGQAVEPPSGPWTHAA